MNYALDKYKEIYFTSKKINSINKCKYISSLINIKSFRELKIDFKKLNKRFTHSWILWKWNDYSNFYWYVKQSNIIMTELADKFWINVKIMTQLSKYHNNYNKALKKRWLTNLFTNKNSND